MKKIIIFALSVLIFFCTAFAQDATNTTDWAQTAAADLDYMYQTYRDNHAGGIDPENPNFNKKLEKEYKKARKKALKVKTEFEYQKTLKGFLSPFNDGHMNVSFKNREFAEFFIKKSLLQNFKELRRPISFEIFNDNSLWVYLNTFLGKESEFKTLAEKLKEEKNREIIVLDLRYNGGGNSENGRYILDSVYNKDYIDYMDFEVNKNTRDYYRATQWASDSFEEAARFFDAQASTEKARKCLADAVKKGEKVCRHSEEKKNLPQVNNTNNSRVYAFTDNVCFSACLYIMDILKGIGSVVQIGLETDGDTKYMQMWNAQLPSGFGQFSISYHGVLGRARKDNETYKPDYRYKGDINDTKAIQSWVIELDKKLNKKRQRN
jgi:hypothetical protein